MRSQCRGMSHTSSFHPSVMSRARQSTDDKTQHITITESKDGYHVSTSTKSVIDGTTITVSLIDDCTIKDDSATCVGQVIGSGGGQKTSTAITTTYTGAEFTDLQFEVGVTAGAEKTASPSGKCNSAAGFNTRAVALWGMLGAAAVGALML
jgi:hypothetical protein